MGKSVFISDNDCVNVLHMTQLNSKERLNDVRHIRTEGQPYGRLCSPWL